LNAFTSKRLKPIKQNLSLVQNERELKMKDDLESQGKDSFIDFNSGSNHTQTQNKKDCFDPLVSGYASGFKGAKIGKKLKTPLDKYSKIDMAKVVEESRSDVDSSDNENAHKIAFEEKPTICEFIFNIVADKGVSNDQDSRVTIYEQIEFQKQTLSQQISHLSLQTTPYSLTAFSKNDSIPNTQETSGKQQRKGLRRIRKIRRKRRNLKGDKVQKDI
jgi:hypothetical protein